MMKYTTYLKQITDKKNRKNRMENLNGERRLEGSL